MKQDLREVSGNELILNSSLPYPELFFLMKQYMFTIF